ncbi:MULTISPECIES: DUF1353 domain-containing protein [Pseudofrankia]|uniref:DUF1353 domain-containing protein n=1 Tax=Pseudofrankia TaxID=2994363 RepID=UPI000234BF9C|nr:MULTISPECIES: DUF1353 domain-containing protein [Pseudofrankia]OHV32058.1 hypothetical protein BCD49_30795 [Pseudofrankia sp. EUN1h]
MAGRVGFFDAETGGELVLVLRRYGNEFQIIRQFGYWDPKYDEPFVVPADPETFLTDLASIPSVFAWLVPGLGSHLPAVLLHDGLVIADGEPSIPTHLGPPVTREEADRILRDAMRELGTPVIRRWLIWTGAELGTLWVARRHRWWWRILATLTVTAVVALGSLATLDLFDVWNVLPWMGDRPWWVELLSGAAAAVGLPAALSVLWGHYWRVAAITGIAMALLLHVTLAVIVVSGVYWVLERLVSWPEGLSPNVAKNLANVPPGTRDAGEPPGAPDSAPDSTPDSAPAIPVEPGRRAEPTEPSF